MTERINFIDRDALIDSLGISDVDIYAKEVISEAPIIPGVHLPCKIGDEVWGLKIYRNRRIATKGKVHQMYFGDDMRLCICVKNVCRGEWGVNVFATKEEAEAALPEAPKGE